MAAAHVTHDPPIRETIQVVVAFQLPTISAIAGSVLVAVSSSSQEKFRQDSIPHFIFDPVCLD